MTARGSRPGPEFEMVHGEETGSPPAAPGRDDVDGRAREAVDEFLGDVAHGPDRLLAVLLHVQITIGFIPPRVEAHIAARLGLPRIQVQGVVSQHRCFTVSPRGRLRLRVCGGAQCRLERSGWILVAIRESTGVTVGETSEDGRLSVEEADCLDACGRAPVVALGDEVHGPLTTAELDALIGEPGRRPRGSVRERHGDD